MGTSRQLDAERIEATVTRLKARISARFPNSGLSRVAGDLEQIARQTRLRCDAIQRPNLLLRLVGVLVSMAIAAIVIGAVTRINPEEWRHTTDNVVEFVQFVEAGLGTVVFLSAAIFFLVTLENRVKRHRALDALFELRSLVHIIDMHQLTKDPERILQRGPMTSASPDIHMTPFLLSRYLDYCSELLSLTSKIGVLYGQKLHDEQVLEVIDQIETLANDLGRKMWQKIMILDRWIKPDGSIAAGGSSRVDHAVEDPRG